MLSRPIFSHASLRAVPSPSISTARLSMPFSSSVKSAKSHHGNGVVGMVAEVYNKWERRAPLCPEHVRKLTKDDGIRVLVEPSARRVFTDEEYAAAGAEITSDLSAAGTIFGVKQVPASNLLPDRTYVFFSHTIKAQAENMELLDTILERNIRMIDYETINKDGLRSAPRLIAFGGYAGRAGLIDGMRGLGERLLSLGYSTPFLSLGSSYMYQSLDLAKQAIKEMGEGISAGGIPRDFAPLVVGFTGDGNVSQGAQEIFRLLPHKMVSVEDLPHLEPRRDLVYGVVAEVESMVRKKAEHGGGALTDRGHYFANPEEYEPIFHEKVAPYLSMLVNCTYWDHRYPRLLTVEQMRDIRRDQRENTPDAHPRLQMVADVSCDIGGSIEFLTKSTHIEDPFFRYDFDVDESTSNEDGSTEGCVFSDMDGDGIIMCGVDILPSELPRESSKHFGDLLYHMVPTLATSDGSVPFSEQNDLPAPLKGACIAAQGELTPNFSYISAMRAERDREAAQTHALKMYEAAGSAVMRLRGHLFDTNLINQTLDLLEEHGASFYVVELDVRPNDKQGDHAPSSSADIQVSVEGGREKLDEILQLVQKLIDVTPKAEAVLSEMPWDYCRGVFSRTLHDVYEQSTTKDSASRSYTAGVSANDSVHVTDQAEIENILVFGAGLVAGPAVEYMSRKPGRTVTVASGLSGEAQALCARLGNPPNVVPMQVDAVGQTDVVDSLIQNSTCVMSLLPATMHIPIVESAIANGVHAVTASYTSDEMRALDQKAKRAGVVILNEMGLDPGMDHMSAQKVIDEVQSNGGHITSFSSLCGGLPAPEAANNPLMYKFSWSPLGVLRASQNASRYLDKNVIVNVAGGDLLCSARPTTSGVFPTLSLEHLPNRDAMPYGDIYGINSKRCQKIYRGTLRYAGWSAIMEEFRKIGLTSKEAGEPYKWGDDMPLEWKSLMDEIQERYDMSEISSDALECLEWLGCFNENEHVDISAGTIIDAFCALLQKRLAYAEGERDMCLMQHEFGVSYDDGRADEIYSSSLLLYGDSDPTGDTSMAKTVGLTIAVGAECVLEGKTGCSEGGVILPTHPDLYIPALEKLAIEGLVFNESMKRV